jgi:transcription antitermination factor NusG
MVRVDPRKQDWRVLHSTKGVSGVVGKARDAEVDVLKALTEDTVDGYYADPASDPPRFNPGEPVQALRGLFEDKFGTYQGLAGNTTSRVRVLFSILNRETEFEVCAYDLQSAAGHINLRTAA